MVRKKVHQEKEVLYIKLESSEAKNAKKDLLYSQMDLLNLIKIMRHYKNLREKEVEKKLKLSKKIYDIKKKISQLKIILPKMKDYENENNKKIKIPSTQKIIPKTSELEKELRDIQEKLRLMEA